MFWFLAFVVVLIILIWQQSSSKEEENSHYLRGRNDERQALAAKINEVTKNNKSQEISLVVLRDIFKNPIKSSSGQFPAPLPKPEIVTSKKLVP